MIKAGTKEFEFCENLLMGMGIPAAGQAAGIPRHTAYRWNKRKDVQEHLDTQRHALRRAAMVTREDVLQGFLDAVQDAKLLSDPGNQIAGWREIARMLGYYEPEKREVHLTGSLEDVRQSLEALPEDELLKLTGPIEDAEFDFLPAPEPEPKSGSKSAKSKH